MNNPDPLRPKGGFADLVGYEIGGWQRDQAELVLTLEAKHLNRQGVMHGGILATLVDAACGYAGCFTEDKEPPRRAFTLSLTCQFIATAAVGAVLTTRAHKTGGGRQTFFSRADVHDQDGRLIGQGTGVHRYRET